MRGKPDIKGNSSISLLFRRKPNGENIQIPDLVADLNKSLAFEHFNKFNC